MASFARIASPTGWMADRSADRRRARRSLFALAAAAVLALVLAAAAVVRLLLPGTGEAAAPHGGQPTPSSTVPAAQPDVTWRAVAGVDLPFSQVDGPQTTGAGQAAGYSQTRRGAALAAVQVLIRTSATAGPAVFDPIMASQVTGVNAAAMKLALADAYQRLRARAQVPDGSSIPGPTARVIGYQVADYRPNAGAAAVDVVITSPALGAGPRYLIFRVQLLWQGQDWRVVAPPGGDWRSVARTTAELPAQLRYYGGGR